MEFGQNGFTSWEVVDRGGAALNVFGDMSDRAVVVLGKLCQVPRPDAVPVNPTMHFHLDGELLTRSRQPGKDDESSSDNKFSPIYPRSILSPRLISVFIPLGIRK